MKDETPEVTLHREPVRRASYSYPPATRGPLTPEQVQRQVGKIREVMRTDGVRSVQSIAYGSGLRDEALEQVVAAYEAAE